MLDVVESYMINCHYVAVHKQSCKPNPLNNCNVTTNKHYIIVVLQQTSINLYLIFHSTILQFFSHTKSLQFVSTFHKVLNRSGPIMLFKLSIILLSNAPKFSLLCLNYAPLCSIMLHKLLLPESKDESLSLTTSISKRLRALNFTIVTQITLAFCLIRQLFLMELCYNRRPR